jgi:ELWxxDGT repeat protein
MLKTATLFIFFAAFSRLLSAQTVELVADLNPAGDGFSEFDRYFLTLGARTLVVADNGQTGQEIYVLENNALSLLKDIAAGAASSDPADLVVAGDKVYFVATGPEGRELWATDGTPGGTAVAVDLTPGASGSNPAYLYADASGDLFFQANSKLYVLATGAAAPVQLNLPGATVNLEPHSTTRGTKIVAFGDGVAVSAKKSSDSLQVWITNGTLAGTKKVASVSSGFFTELHSLVVVNDRVLFTVDNGFSQSHPSDGLYATTTLPGDPLVRLIDAGSSSANKPARFLPADSSKAFFHSLSGFWVTDGTVAGTIKLTGSLFSYFTQGVPAPFAYTDGKALFAGESSLQTNVYKSNGTLAGTGVLEALPESFVEQFMAYSHKVYFVSGITNGFLPKIWTSDFTAAGTQPIYQYNVASNGPSLVLLGAIGNYLYFQSNVGSAGRELYRLQIALGVPAHEPVESSSSFDLAYNPLTATGRIAADQPGLPLTLTVYDLAGRLVQQLSAHSDEEFYLTPFSGAGVLVVQSRGKRQAFKLVGY